MFTSSSTKVTMTPDGCRIREVFERKCMAAGSPDKCTVRRAVFRQCPGDATETLVEQSGGKPGEALDAQQRAAAAQPDMGGGSPFPFSGRGDLEQFFKPFEPWASPADPWGAPQRANPNRDRSVEYAGKARDV